ncbi:MAG: DUF4160 domain-containing protein [Acetobacteraceae bacterium]|jgi:hypothetical protein
MVTVHYAFGFRFVIFANDHTPPHVHVFGHGGEAKIDLAADGGAHVTWERNISRADLRRILIEARDHHQAPQEAWRRMHGG